MTDIVEKLRAKWIRPLFTPTEFAEAADEIERLRKIEAAARNLVAVKGRHHTDQAYKHLEGVLG